MNLGALIDACERRTGFNDPFFRTEWRDFVNEAVREFARRYPWPGLEDEFTHVAPGGQRFLTFPGYVEDILDLHDLTNHAHIDRDGEFGRQAARTFSQNTAGRPVMYEPLGDVAVLNDPVGFVHFRSANESDTSVVFVTGLAANSGASGTPLDWSQQTVEASANGQTPVTLSTLFTRITSVGRETNTAGDYRFFDAGAADAWISVIPAAELDARFRRIQFMRVPNTAVSLRVRFRHRVARLVTEAQAPPPAVDDDFVINQSIAIYQREKEQFTKAQVYEQKATGVAATRSNKEANFGESHNEIEPFLPLGGVVDDDNWRGGW